MTSFQVYMVMQLDTFKCVSDGFTVVFTFVCIISSVAILTSGTCRHTDEDAKYFFNILKWMYPPILILWLCFTASSLLVPSTKTACAMVAVPSIVNNEEITADMAEIYRLGVERIKEELGDEEKK